MHEDLASLLPGVLAVAWSAGREIMRIYAAADLHVELKADNSPLTAADRAAHQAIAAGLARLSPSMPLWSEESATVAWETRQHWREFWLVDPLDGTREFIKRNGEFTVNIALVRDQVPVLGVVYAPALDRTYAGSLGAGAWRADGNKLEQPIRVHRLPKGPVRVAGSRSHRGDSLNRFLGRVGAHELVGMGSSLKFCLVAEGAADVYPRLGPTSAWDTAAGQAVLEAAGGTVTDLQGVRLRYNAVPEVLNPHFVAAGGPGHDWLGLLRD